MHPSGRAPAPDPVGAGRCRSDNELSPTLGRANPIASHRGPAAPDRRVRLTDECASRSLRGQSPDGPPRAPARALRPDCAGLGRPGRHENEPRPLSPRQIDRATPTAERDRRRAHQAHFSDTSAPGQRRESPHEARHARAEGVAPRPSAAAREAGLRRADQTAPDRAEPQREGAAPQLSPAKRPRQSGRQVNLAKPAAPTDPAQPTALIDPAPSTAPHRPRPIDRAQPAAPDRPRQDGGIHCLPPRELAS